MRNPLGLEPHPPIAEPEGVALFRAMCAGAAGAILTFLIPWSVWAFLTTPGTHL